MTIDEARKVVLGGWLRDWGWGYDPGDLDVIVDGRLSADDLEAMAMVMRDDQKRASNQEPVDHG